MMASVCLSVPTSKTLSMPSPSSPTTATYKSSAAATDISAHTCSLVRCRCSMLSIPMFDSRRFVASNRARAKKLQLVRMAPDEEKLTRRNPLDFPIEWERPKPGRRPDIFPQFSPMKTPLPPPLPYDPPEEDEEDEEKKEEEEEDPEREEPDQPDKQ
ncbi:uncharacterized protein LOC122308293 [Carya illinoinensis]|uniref:Uncharacterized protein n=1 Tax=Carya illinoinensis TaxID=32201 RepID=A0A8T1QVC3_CARIL|nr:uncharacterized protein LOC122308293 [Carya illinoinensis]XP_042977473.1 uncharacterized protein LOC122308293 [Carya illinoinensis]XP_042977474.1 uncharacterized protein LOC122308293 [Carya illinoinensis]KAG6658475.1 hypothetical protein CIPAW_04G164300 [Carya illinoinensis]KAG6658476.1 hypothetical protein CIPAW_04G164300 [Carya illinoinensis]KAG6658477.1 hypothetical protein CIPAW_04G164300 [Carya illinoinensis]